MILAYKVVIDAGHGGRDPGAVYQGRQEKDDALALALAVGEALENAGVDVVYTRTEDVYDTPYEKAVIANNSGADYFISIHRNATASPGGASGIETLVYSKGGEAERLAENINEELAGLGFTDRGITERPNLVVLRRTQMPAVLIEAGFIDSPADNEKFDAEFNEIATGIADAFLKTVGSDMGTQERPEENPPLYQVQVGAYRVQQFADQMLAQLQSEGLPAYIEEGDDKYYRVKVGAFENLDNAAQMEQRLRRMGYNTFITTT
ncbi:N-acetylmuramoyl-L-alanine amidase [Lacrimispora sp. NSJ-141]|uniref:N-acetylmuramoyl-L-alanine amidase n=1 Tax=Lientehia hominis TaxID=2897778 RepID=A0AAP2RKV2_9FIRM|nr:N-acetylmuramoyl-L-alanine amidase [Lientehia hominis]